MLSSLQNTHSKLASSGMTWAAGTITNRGKWQKKLQSHKVCDLGSCLLWEQIWKLRNEHKHNFRVTATALKENCKFTGKEASSIIYKKTSRNGKSHCKTLNLAALMMQSPLTIHWSDLLRMCPRSWVSPKSKTDTYISWRWILQRTQNSWIYMYEKHHKTGTKQRESVCY